MSLPSGYNRWCRRYRPAEHAAVRLVCFPHAGGSAPFYLPMAAALSLGSMSWPSSTRAGRNAAPSSPLPT